MRCHGTDSNTGEQVSLSWEFSLIHCNCSELNWSLNMWTELTGRRLVLNLSFLPLFCVMIRLNLTPPTAFTPFNHTHRQVLSLVEKKDCLPSIKTAALPPCMRAVRSLLLFFCMLTIKCRRNSVYFIRMQWWKCDVTWRFRHSLRRMFCILLLNCHM